MSEEILRALMQLFAIIAKQESDDSGKERLFVEAFLIKQIRSEKIEEYLELFDKHLAEIPGRKAKASPLTSVKDSVRILKICKQINKTLTHRQKVLVVMRTIEMAVANGYSPQRKAIIDTVADVFNIDDKEYRYLTSFVTRENEEPHEELLHIGAADTVHPGTLVRESLNEGTDVLLVNSAGLILLRHNDTAPAYLNGMPLTRGRITPIAPGSIIKYTKGQPVYYSDLLAHFHRGRRVEPIHYEARNISYTFRNKTVGVHPLSINESENSLIGIMGLSGAGKTTLLNMLTGLKKPATGQITINGIDLIAEPQKLKGTIGYIPQDDLLNEHLTVYENLYFSSLFCFGDKSSDEVKERVNKMLESLGLERIAHLKVGSPLNKLISGGQRKRLNIALELIREPSVLFVDEPTSGLSSRDSENIMDLFRELAFKGKLIFVVIHQPSSEIYKLFDKIILMDTGGFMADYGNPLDVIAYLKKQDRQPDAESVECPRCGNVNPEQIFDILHAHVVDEYGRYGKERKRSPRRWNELFKAKELPTSEEKVLTPPPNNLRLATKLKQWWIYLRRDIKSKISNKQYLGLALMEAPMLALILAYLVRFIPSGSIYIFRENENLPQYIFMVVIVALFLGLTISAEEIFRDRKILRREAFLNLSKTSYFLAKTTVMLALSALQALAFVLIGNGIFGIESMTWSYWLAFFSVSVFANMLGLNISSAFDEVVSIYILIPLLIIPQMVLGGAMFSFDKMNKNIVRVDKVPVVAELMTAKWAYEALMVDQFKNNPFEKIFYPFDQKEAQANYYQVYYVPQLRKQLQEAVKAFHSGNNEVLMDKLLLLKNEALTHRISKPHIAMPEPSRLSPELVNEETLMDYQEYVDRLANYYSNSFAAAHRKKQAAVQYYLHTYGDKFYQMRNRYHNEALADLVRKTFEKHKILLVNHRLIQHVDPVFQWPQTQNKLDFRSQLFAPKKAFAGRYFETFYFNMSIIWLMSILLFITLRFNIFRRVIEWKPRFIN